MSQGPPSGGELRGQGASLHDAVQDAWNKRGGNDPREYVVGEIKVTGTNPISGYLVTLRPGH
jgi:hypothetical protein